MTGEGWKKDRGYCKNGLSENMKYSEDEFKHLCISKQKRLTLQLHVETEEKCLW